MNNENTIHYHFFFLLLVLNISCSTSNKNNKEAIEGYLLVKKVVDGDTFWANDHTLKGLKIRLIGVDAPESRKTFRKEVGHYGKEAKAFLKNLIDGKNVKLEFDVGKFDQYHRTLAYVYLEDGTFVNAELVKQGYGMVMTVPPNVKFADLFVKLQEEARENERGLWKK